MRKFITPLIAAVFLMLSGFSETVLAQSAALVQGQVLNTSDQPVAGAAVLLQHPTNPELQAGAYTDADGQFRLRGLEAGEYTMRIAAIGFDTLAQTVALSEGFNRLGQITLNERTFTADEVQIEGQVAQAQQKGDTTQYNAGAFQTNPDANAEDLIRKMPGITVDNGRVNAQGEQVRQVLVDGKPFFGSDPNAALKNLPAEVIEKIEVFDQQSEQSQATGFDDGNTTKTINIVTRPETRNGTFGRMYAGGGYEDVYKAGLSLNFFNDDQRISVVGLSNNINQQNFSQEDLLGVASAGRGRRGRPWEGGGVGADPGDFLIDQQNGVATTHSGGINYSDELTDKLEMNASYFFNYTDNNALTTLDRVYFVEGDSGLVYRELDSSRAVNINHRFNLRMEYKPNERNSILWRPSVSFQQSQGADSTFGRNLLNGASVNATENVYSTDFNALRVDNFLRFTHRFEKRGRSLTLSLRNGYNLQNGNSDLGSSLFYFTEPGASQDTLNQRSYLSSNGLTLNVDARYSEPLGKVGLLLVSYNYAPQWNQSDQNTWAITAEGDSTLLAPQSSVFENQYYAHRAGVGTLLRKGRELFFISRIDYQRASLAGQQTFPTVFDSTYSFNNLLPFAIFRWRISNQTNLRVIYRTSIDVPTVSQLQEVVDNSNPLQLSTGNPTLAQAYSHRLVLRYGGTDTETGRVLYFLLNGSLTNDYIGNSSLIARRDTTLPSGIVLQPGAQLSRPVNLDGFRSVNTLFTLGFPVKFIKSNFNINLSGNYTRRPGLINEELNFSDNYQAGAGVTLSSNISEKVDFTVSSRTNYNWAFNELRPNLNTEYLSQVSEARLNLIFGPGIVFRSSLLHQYTQGLSDGLDPNYLLWNVSVAKKLFENQRGEIELTAFDVLGQNTSVNRNVSSIFVEDVQTQVLQRYFMLTFTYNLRQFEAGSGGESPYGPGGYGGRPDGPPRRP